jgi:2-polyprenyl-6-methoxyphenol hydroxylase-like FAD-dependent oxidoreductase
MTRAFNAFFMEHNRIQVEVTSINGWDQHLYCSYLVGADGVNSPVRKCIDSADRSGHNEVVIYLLPLSGKEVIT